MTEQLNKEDRRREAVARIAYFKWVDAGSPSGDGSEFWFAAELEYEKNKKKIEDIKLQVMAQNPTICFGVKACEKEVAPSANRPPMPLPSEFQGVKRRWYRTLWERLFPAANLQSGTSPLKDYEK